jgi:hephaestin
LYRSYTKALFFQYTDVTFTTRVNRSEEDAYLGFTGPLMRARVGDSIRVVFVNKLR